MTCMSGDSGKKKKEKKSLYNLYMDFVVGVFKDASLTAVELRNKILNQWTSWSKRKEHSGHGTIVNIWSGYADDTTLFLWSIKDL